ncbi:uncharacterized protein LOC114540634 [Dendronephthya gigantea]|uniref:uncharacterized protein LOC114540634 n=1 Tax=Dendronephthya gigantea TaxID=151771 RepID=UPI00106A7385|nr:uncharacterized protein LOC114540634 [Dendronephthya gigantea]
MLSPVNCYDDNGEGKNNSMSFLCNHFLLNVFEGCAGNSILAENIHLQTCLEESRSFFFEEDFISLVVDAPSEVVTKKGDGTSTFLPKDQSCNVDIYIICSSEDIDSCSLLKNIITSQNGSQYTVKVSTDENASTRLTYLDKAWLIIPLLSSSFMQCPELVHELNIAWCRQRDCLSLCFLAIVLEQLPNNPTYVSLFPCFFNCEDGRWVKDRETLKLFPSDELTRVYKSCQCPLNVVLCFMTVVDHIQQWHNGSHCLVLGTHNKLFNCLHLNACIQQHKEVSSKCNEEAQEKEVVSSTCSTKGNDKITDETARADDDDNLKPSAPNECQNQDSLISSTSNSRSTTAEKDEVPTEQGNGVVRADNDDSCLRPSGAIESQNHHLVLPQEIKHPDKPSSDVKVIESQQMSNIENIDNHSADDLGKETSVKSRHEKRLLRKNDLPFRV